MLEKEPPLQSPIGDKLTWVTAFCREKKETLLRDEGTSLLFEKLKAAIKASRRAMILAGIAEQCRLCEEDESGSCCGKGIENRYSGSLLLINCLLDRELPLRRRFPDSCFFLGDEGCRLLARHVICINYLCKKITDRIEPKKIAALREKEGEEVECLFLLNERIKAFFKAKG